MSEIIGKAKLGNSVSLQPRNVENGKKENQSIFARLVCVGHDRWDVPGRLAQ
jgi:hypothetical protein